MKIAQLLANIVNTDLNIEVTGLCLTASHIQPGDVFVALQGQQSHGIEYANQAIDRGCVAILVDSKKVECGVPTIQINHLTDQLPALASTFYADALNVSIIGITGTNGKTSVAHFIAQLSTKLGINTGLIGTLGITQSQQPSSHTTPDILTLYRTLSHYHQQHINLAVLEVSSHALAQNRIAGLNITQAVWTNFSQDHLDYHQTLDAYKLEKLKLLKLPSVNNVVLNKEDACYQDFAHASEDKISSTYSFNDFDDIKTTPHGFLTQLEHYVFELPFLGKFNLMNVLAAYQSVKALGFSADQIVPLLSQLTPPPGRMQKINHQLTWIDYAHTPDALENALITLQHHYPEHNIRVVFGCGGNRDQSKRAIMGKIASKHADTIILTNDNPRNEDPRTIINDILNGIDDSYPVDIIEDRQLAIETAVTTLNENECLLIAGKGHETTQTFKHKTLNVNDRDIAQTAHTKMLANNASNKFNRPYH